MQIYGSKKGQGKQRQPVIAPDSAQSKTYINMLFGLGEGEIAGLANGYKSVYLDDTPLQNDNGEFNFPNVKVDFRNGTNDQTYIDGFPDVSSETAVNVELKHGTPYIKAFNNLDLDALRVRLKWGALRSQNAENGDVNGIKIDYAIDLKTDNGGWVQVLSLSVNAKTSDAYERSHRIDLPPATTGWQVRVRRLTPNSTSELVSDRMFVSAITEVIDLKLRYPNIALLGLRYDATSFSNVAKMSARCKGLIIKVPTNYDPVARTYTGLWNGEFKLAYSNNPAWVYYDLCTNARYGLGGRLTPAMIDKWSLYRLAQYCDEQVSDGMGGQEPRFTVNVYIQSADGAFELLSKLAGVFRAISYWDGNSIVLDADIPQDSIYSFSRANVIDGVFEYTGTRARDRHTVAKVAWDNPANHFKTEYEFVRDEQAIAKFGTNIAEISAWGCTSKGQAQRAGLWALKSEQLETRMVTFKVGLDGYIPSPAKVIEISDELFAGRANGGRVVAINKNKTVITLDRPITAKANDTLVINGDDGFSQRRLIKSINGDKITVTKAFGDISVENVWVLDSQDLATMKFRVLSVTADENHQFTITAVQYNPDKYDAIDTGAYIDERPISVINPTIQAPTKSVNLSSYHTVNQGVSVTTLVIGWEQVTGAVKYVVEWRKDDGNWQTLPPTGTNSIEVAGVYAGQYEARVTAISAFGQMSTATHSTLTQIHGKQGKPNKLARLTATGKLFAMDLNWAFGAKSDDTNFTEIQVSPDGRSNITTLGTFAYPTNKHEITGLQGGLTQFYRARIVDKLGNTSDWTAWVRGVTDNQAEKVLNLISGQISESHLNQSLATPIAKIGGLETDLNGVKTQIPTIRNEITNAKTALQNAIDVVNAQLPTLNGQIATLNSKAATLQNELNIAKSTLQTAVNNITTERNRITTAIRDIGALQTANNAKTQELANLTQTVNGHTSQVRELAVTTGDLSQKYTQLKTASDTANSEITAIKQTQNGQATSIEKIGAKFDNLAVGGRNLLRNTQNPTATNPIRHPTAERPRIDNLQISYDDNIMTLQASNANNRYALAWWSDSRLDLEPNTDYVFTGFVKAQSDAELSMRWWKYLNRWISHVIKFNATTEWTKFTIKFSVPNEPITGAFIDLIFNVPVDNAISFKQIKLEKGSIPTDWTPAPEDLQADIDNKATTANLETLRQTLTNADTALSQQITAMDTAYKSTDRQLTANLASETTARTNADTALTQRIDSLTADYNGNKANIANQIKALSDKDTATASQISQLTANVSTANSKADTATTKADNAQNTANNALSRANTANSAITAEQKARADADSSLASQITALDTAYKSADSQLSGRITTAQQTATNAQNAVASVQSELTAKFDSLAVGGRNYAEDGNFNRGLWLATKHANSDATFSKENGVLSINGTNTNWKQWQIQSKEGTRANIANTSSALALLQDGETYTLSVEARSDSDTGGLINLKIADDRVSGSTPARIDVMGKNNIALTTEWKRYFITGIIRKSPEHNIWRIILEAHGATQPVYFRNVKLEKGSIPTDWTPAPEDTQSQLDDKASTATLNEFKQTSANADTALGERITAIDTAYKQADTATNAKLANAEKAISDNNTALSERITALDTAYKSDDNNLTARLAREETARASGDNANAQALRTLESTVNGIGGRVGTSESKIATLERTTSDLNGAIATAQNQLNARFDNLSVGGRNLLRNTQNPTATSPIYHATATAPRLDGVTVAYENEVMTVQATKASNRLALAVWSDSRLDLEPNTDYVLSGYVKAQSDVRLATRWFRYVARWINQVVTFNATTDWTKFTVKFSMPDEQITGAFLDLIINVPMDNAVSFKLLKLEKGNIATDWTPAPEDTQSQLDEKASTATLDEFKRTQAQKDTATASQISSLTANVSTAQQTANTANGKADTATTKADNAQNTANNALTRANTANTAITAEQKARADADIALGQRITAIDTAYKSADSQTTAKLGQLEQSISDKDRAMAQRVDTLTANYTALDNRTKWVELTAVTDLNTLTETGKYFILAGNNPNAPFAQYAYVVVEKARNNRITQTAWADNNASLVYTRVYNGAWQAWEKTATGKELDTKASVASLNEFKQAQATKDTATAQAVQTLQTTVNGQSASIQQHAQSLNGLSAQWTLKVQSGNIVSGIGLASSNGVSDFAVRADKFYIASPTGQKGDTPFTVLTSPQVINGVQVPAGTYIKSAFIQDGSITNAKIANASIDNAKIANGSIDNAKIANGSIDTAKIRDGVITTAKIGVAQIDTLQIAGEAVTVPRMQYNAGIRHFTQGGEIELGRMTMNSQGGNVMITIGFARLFAVPNGIYSWGKFAPAVENNDFHNFAHIHANNMTGVATGDISFHVRRNGVEIHRVIFKPNYAKSDTNAITSVSRVDPILLYDQYTMPYILDTPPAGDNVYSIVMTVHSNRVHSNSDRTIERQTRLTGFSFMALGVKR